MIFRGVVEVPETRLTLEIGKKLTAVQTTAEGVPGKVIPFGVFLRTSESRVLIPRFFYLSQLRQVQDSITVIEPKKRPDKVAWHGDLYLEQKAGAQTLVAALLKYHGAIGRGRCGVGKTVLATHVISEIRAATTLVLVDRTNLAEQWAAAVHERLPDLSIDFVMPADTAASIRKKCGLTKPEGRADVTIALVQSVIANDRSYEATLLIVDEVHKFSAPCFSKAVFKMSFRYSLGLTATDERRDGLSWVFRSILGTRTVQLAGRRLTPTVLSASVPVSGRYASKRYRMLYCRYFQKSVIADDCLICPCPSKTGLAPCPHRGGLSKSVNFTRLMLDLAKDERRNEGITAITKSLVINGHHVIVMSKFKQHLINLRDMYTRDAPAVDTSLYFGGMEREALDKRVTFATYGMGEHGLDAPWKSAIVLALPLSDPEQAVGRVERVFEGKKAPIIVDPYVHYDFLGAQWTRRRRFYAKAGYSHRIGTVTQICAWLDYPDAQRSEKAAGCSG